MVMFGSRRDSSTTAPVPLSAQVLEALEDTLSVPGYDRRRVTTGIVHIGVGGFHRAHQALYLDRIMSGGAALDWGICGVGVMPADREMRDALEAQDHLYTVVEKHGDVLPLPCGTSTRLLGCCRCCCGWTVP